jgi:hypothetical protein
MALDTYSSQSTRAGGDAPVVSRTLKERRVAICALYLNNLLKPLTLDEIDMETFAQQREAQAQELIKASFGKPLLAVIGFMYQTKATQFLNKYSFSGLKAHLSERAHAAKVCEVSLLWCWLSIACVMLCVSLCFLLVCAAHHNRRSLRRSRRQRACTGL